MAPVDRRSRAIAAGIAALVLVGSVGVGGFALGRTTADHRDGDHPRFPQGFSDGDRPQPPAGFPGGDGDFDGDGDGPGGLPYGDDDGGAGTDESGTTSSS